MDQVMSPQEIKNKKPYLEWGLSEKEYEYICNKLLQRLPNYTETGLFAVMWSEHCSYKMSKPLLKLFPNKNDKVLEGPGEGAGIIDIGDGLAVTFKAESHNHPSAIEPYEGAATGVGGILRDIFSMGARPIASLDSLHFGEIKDAQTKHLINQVIAGIGGYGNCIGVPTIAGETTFDECYQGNPLVNAMSIGLLKINDIQHGKAQGLDNAIIYVGAKTGRDGIHGATFASNDFSDENETQRSAVQVGDPFMEKLLMEACLELIQKHPNWLVGIQDMGAAGLVSSSCEMASKAKTGVVLNLDLVPQREEQMNAYEIMLSESQERMLLCVQKEHVNEVIQLFKKYNLDAVKIGYVTDDAQYKLMHNNELVANIPVSSLTTDVLQEKGKEEKPKHLIHDQNKSQVQIADPQKTFYELLKQPTIASKKMFTQTYDSQVRAATIFGPNQIADAGVIKIRNSQKALAATTDGNGRFVYLNPRIGGEIAVLEAAMNILSVGAEPLGITDCLNYGDPHNPEVYWELHQSILGMAKACKKLNTPVVSGNVSLYNENNGKAIYPTPMVGMVGLMENVNKRIHNKISDLNSILYLIGNTDADFSGSEIQKMLTGKIKGSLSEINWDEKLAEINLIKQATKAELISAAHDVSEGGLAVTLAEMLFDTSFGINLNVSFPLSYLFSETPGRMVACVPNEKCIDFEKLFQGKAHKLGIVTNKSIVKINCSNGELNFDVKEAHQTWQESLPNLMEMKN